MRSLLALLIITGVAGCTSKESPPERSKTPPPPPVAHSSEDVGANAGSAPAPAPAETAPPPSAGDGADEVAALVVHDVGSKALGNQKIEASCVSVAILPAGKWFVAAAHLDHCGDKNARSIVWLYKRTEGGKWNEDYVGQPPKCWKGVPPDLATAVAKATNIPSC